MIENFLSAIWAIIEFQIGDGVSLAFILAVYIPHNSLDFVAAAGWANFDLDFGVHGYIAFFEEIRK
jgi:hypothetical protein